MNHKKLVIILFSAGLLTMIVGILSQHRWEPEKYYTSQELVQSRAKYDYYMLCEPAISGPFKRMSPSLMYNIGSPAQGFFDVKNGGRITFFHEGIANHVLLVDVVENQAGECDYFLFGKEVEKK